MTVNFELTKAQEQFVLSEDQFVFMVAGLGSGKSYSAALKSILHLIKYPDSWVFYFLPTFGLISDIAFPTFIEILDKMNIEYEIRKGDSEIYLKGCSGKIAFRSLTNPEKIIGITAHLIVVDEADVVRADQMHIAYNKILGRLRQKIYKTRRQIKANKTQTKTELVPPQLAIISSPEGFGFFYNIFEVNPPKGALLLRSKTTENKFLPASYIQNMREIYPKNLFDAYVNGQFVNLTQGTVYSYFSRDQCHEVKDRNETLHVSVDFNIGGSVITVSNIIGKGLHAHVEVFDEYAAKDTQDIIRYLKNKYPERTIICYPDASGSSRSTNSTHSDIDLLTQAGFQIDVAKSNPRVQERVNVANNKFEKEEITICPLGCPNLVQAFERQAYDEKGQPEKFSGPATVDDYTDSFTYLIHRKFNVSSARVGVKNVPMARDQRNQIRRR